MSHKSPEAKQFKAREGTKKPRGQKRAGRGKFVNGSFPQEAPTATKIRAKANDKEREAPAWTACLEPTDESQVA